MPTIRDIGLFVAAGLILWALFLWFVFAPFAKDEWAEYCQQAMGQEQPPGYAEKCAMLRSGR